jgi:AcrR family transcriptional regulator
MPHPHVARLARRAPGRPRRSPDQEAEVRSRVVEIAARLFRDEGIGALSMRRIAREAGVSAMSLYDYFSSKNEIIRGIWERFFSRCFDRVAHAAARAGKPRDRLHAACAAYMRYWLDHPDEYRAVFMIEDRIESQERYYVETSSILARYRIFAQLLAQHLGLTDRASERLRERAVALICALNGICHMLVTVSEHSWPPPARLLDEALRMADGPLQ